LGQCFEAELQGGVQEDRQRKEFGAELQVGAPEDRTRKEFGAELRRMII